MRNGNQKVDQSKRRQTIVRDGQKAAVVRMEECHLKTTSKGTLAEFFATSPLPGSGLKLKRIRGRARKVNL